MADPFSPVGGEINEILNSTVDVLEQFADNVQQKKVTAQQVLLFVQSLERRDHALNSRFDSVVKQKVDYQMPEHLKQRLLKDIFQLENDHNIGARIKQMMTTHAAWRTLNKIKSTIRSERYKIKVDKTESGRNLQRDA